MGLLDRLEAGIERAVQGTFARHMRSAVHPVEIASDIRRAMDDRAVQAGGRSIVPNVFLIELSSGDYDRLAPELEDIEMDLVVAAEEHCSTQRYQPAGPIDIHFAEMDDLETGVFRLRPSKASRPRASGTTGAQRRVTPPAAVLGSAAEAGPMPDAPPPAWGGESPARSGVPIQGPLGEEPFDIEGEQYADQDDAEYEEYEAQEYGAPERSEASAPAPVVLPPPPAERAPAPPTARPRRANPADRPWLDVDGERYPLMGAITVLGRDDSADVILDDPGISRRHSEFRVSSDGPHYITTLRDLGSTNGTYCNGEKITSIHLEDGDRLTVGRTSITYRAGRR